MSIQQKLANAKSAIQTYNNDVNNQKLTMPYVAAGTAASKGIDEFAQAAEAFENGDMMGGSASMLRGLGSLSTALAIVGPAGAAFGALLGVITGIISAILDAMKPASESLEAKIEKLIIDGELRTAYNALTGDKAAWDIAEVKIKSLAEEREEATGKLKAGILLSDEDRKKYEALAAGVTWEYLTQNIGWESHYGLIVAAFNTLTTNQGHFSKQWLPLYDLTITYALRFWCNFESMAGLINSGEHTKHIPGQETKTFYEMRELIAKTFGEAIQKNHYASLTEVNFYHLYLTNSSNWPDPTNPFSRGTGGSHSWFNTIEHRVGVVNAGENKGLPGTASNFAIAESGTIFASGTQARLYVGRGGEWFEAKGCPACDQVFIHEGKDDIIIVCLHDNGHKVSFCGFDDAQKNEQGWSYSDDRWKGWSTYETPYTILSLAVRAQPDSWTIYAFALESSGEGSLFEGSFSAGQPINMRKIEISGLLYTKENLCSVTYTVCPEPDRSEISPCAVSVVGDSLFFQVGNRIHVREGASWATWLLEKPGELDDLEIQVYQARAFADGTLLCATNKGLKMRYYDLKINGPAYASDPSIQTQWLWKEVSRQASAVPMLLQLVKDAPQLKSS